jgi:acetyltransferase-like isoleucine patch superfamily enzyme
MFTLARTPQAAPSRNALSASWVEGILPLKIQNNGANNEIAIDETVVGNASLIVIGSNNVVRIGEGCAISGPVLEIRGDYCQIVIGHSCKLIATIRCRSNRAIIAIGDYTTMLGATITCHESGSVEIGADCMFSVDVKMDVSDMHPIVDRDSRERINPPSDIVIGDHVWLAHGVTVSKGCRIGAGSVVGGKSLARGDIPKNVIVAGVPAKVIRENIEWARKFT